MLVLLATMDPIFQYFWFPSVLFFHFKHKRRLQSGEIKIDQNPHLLLGVCHPFPWAVCQRGLRQALRWGFSG